MPSIPALTPPAEASARRFGRETRLLGAIYLGGFVFTLLFFA